MSKYIVHLVHLGGARRAESTTGGDGRQGYVGKASLKVKRLCVLLDPRRKALGADQLVNGSAALRTRAEEDLQGVTAEFAYAQTQPSVDTPSPEGSAKSLGDDDVRFLLTA